MPTRDCAKSPPRELRRGKGIGLNRWLTPTSAGWLTLLPAATGLTNAGLDADFMQPLELAKPGFVVEQSASLGMVRVQQVLGTVIRRVIGRMNGAQLLSVCGSIGQFVR